MYSNKELVSREEKQSISNRAVNPGQDSLKE